jgi:AcrR family transcriptional regulator
MPRISEPRAPALPATDDQRARHAAILRAAARLARSRALDQIQAQEIAAEAGVALRTLYRYYPSKHHVYAAVLTSQIEKLKPPTRQSPDAATAVAELMAEACRNVLRYKHLAHAMITSTQAVRAHSAAAGDRAVRDTILTTAGITDPTPAQDRVARLIEQATFGVLTWTVGGELDPDQAVDDVRLACSLLAADLV